MTEFWEVHRAVREKVERSLMKATLLIGAASFAGIVYAVLQANIIIAIQLQFTFAFLLGLVTGFYLAEASYTIMALVEERRVKK